MTYIFSKTKYLNYNKMTEATAPKHLKKFLKECEGKEVDTSYFTYNKGWGFNVFDVKETEWTIPCERLEKYCVAC